MPDLLPPEDADSVALVRRMFEHQRWADERTLAALRQRPDLPQPVRARFLHVVAVEHVWLTRIRGVPATVAIWPDLPLDECERLIADNHRGFLALLDAGARQLQRPCTYKTSDGRTFTNLVVDILVHTALHGSWHRGQVATLMRQDGAEPAPTDYIAFVRGAPAARS
jgi:uncharacterized damage-inducible protein DinB